MNILNEQFNLWIFLQKTVEIQNSYDAYWDSTPLFVKYNPGLLDMLALLDNTSLQTGI